MPQNRVSGSDDVEADPQPTESTSSWSGSLQPDMGRITHRRNRSDGDFRPDSYNKEKSSEDYYRVVEKQRKIEKQRSLSKNIKILFSGPDDVEADPQPTERTSSRSGSLQPDSYDKEKSSEDYNQREIEEEERILSKMPQNRVSGSDDVEADPQPTESTSSWSGSLQPDMGRIRQKTSSSDGRYRPDMEADPQPTESTSSWSGSLRRSPAIDRPNMEADPQPTESTSSRSGFLQVEMGRITHRRSSSDGRYRPDMEADPQPTESTSSWSGSLSYDKEKSSEDYYRVVEKQREIEERILRKNLMGMSHHSAAILATPPVEADPQPTERTSSMSGPLRPDMGRIRQQRNNSDGHYRPDRETPQELKQSSILELHRRRSSSFDRPDFEAVTHRDQQQQKTL